MSEYQFVAFRAIDGPVSEKNLQYMRRQSSRAEVTPWSFENEYHYGDFGGDEVEMLKRGYDMHLHYANFGIRKLMLHLPHGFPDPGTAKAYLNERFTFDKIGQGGILTIEPYDESGSLDGLYDINDFLDRLVPLRAEILDGDLRPLYLANLAVATDNDHDPDETTEAPVPGGLKKLTKAQEALAEMYGLGSGLLAAAARQCPAMPDRGNAENDYASWLERLPAEVKDTWLAQLMVDAGGDVKKMIMAEFQKEHPLPPWPAIRLDRTIAELQKAAEQLEVDANIKAKAKAALTRSKKLANMAADPLRTLKETEDLVAIRSTKTYESAATLLADLREALAGSAQSELAEQQARKLKNANPTLKLLTTALRRKGFVPKGT